MDPSLTPDVASSDRHCRVGLAQWLPKAGQLGDGLDEALEYVARLAAEGCDLVILPELWPCRHDPSDPTATAEEARRRAEPIDGPRNVALAAAAQQHGIWLAAGSMPERADAGIFNTAPLFTPEGQLHAMHRKAHLYRPMHEDRAFSSGDCLTVFDTPILGRTGLVICYDGDFPEVARAMRRAGARVVIQVDAYEVGAESWWDRLYPANALANGQWWLMVNQCGTRGETTFLGKSQIVSPLGEVVAQAVKAASGETPEPDLVVHEISVDGCLREADQQAASLFTGLRKDLPVEIVGKEQGAGRGERVHHYV